MVARHDERTPTWPSGGRSLLEGEVALQTLAQRFPHLQVTGPPQRRPGSAIRCYADIPMTAPILAPTP